jgi:hypothetical protein
MSKYTCDTCDVTLANTSKTNHLKSKTHLRNLANVVETTPLERLDNVVESTPLERLGNVVETTQLERPQALPYICKVCNVELKTTYSVNDPDQFLENISDVLSKKLKQQIILKVQKNISDVLSKKLKQQIILKVKKLLQGED